MVLAMRNSSRRVLLQLITPLLAVAVSTLLATKVKELRGNSYLFIFMAAVVIATRLGGLFSGFLAIILSVGSIAYWLMPPDNSFAISEHDNLLRLTLFSVVALMVLAIHGSRGKSELELRASEQRLALALDSAHMGVWDYNLLTRK